MLLIVVNNRRIVRGDMSDQYDKSTIYPVVLGYRFLMTITGGGLVAFIVCQYATPSSQLLMFSLFGVVIAALLAEYAHRCDELARRHVDLLQGLALPFGLAPEHHLFPAYMAIANTLTGLRGHDDPVFQECALSNLSDLRQKLSALADGKVVFDNTEAWRTIYEQLLRDRRMSGYLSVAWIRNEHYWQHGPGRESMRTNFDLAHKGVPVRRIVILGDDLWSQTQQLPVSIIRTWIDDQRSNGIHLYAVRESDLREESELLVDFGIYGDRAAGTQELDERGRTVRFVLDFSRDSIHRAHDRWERLMLYATPFEELASNLLE